MNARCPICNNPIYMCPHDIGKYRVYYYSDNVVTVWAGKYPNNKRILRIDRLVLLDEERIEKLLLLQ